MNRVIGESKELFLLYCFVRNRQLEGKFEGFPTVKKSHLFIDNNTGFIRLDKILEYKNSIIDAEPDAENKISKIATAYEMINGNDYFNLISGKFLMQSLQLYLMTFIKNVRIDDLNWCLIENFDISKLDYVKNSILQNVITKIG